MIETIELRMEEEKARRVLSAAEGRYIGLGARKLCVDTRDPLYSKIKAASEEYKRIGSFFFTSWDTTRTYSPTELDSAEIFQLRINSIFEPCGEQCGTEYDKSD